MSSAHFGGCAQRCFSLQALPREAWKNQGGWTRTVASATDGQGQVLWRVSVADITAAGAFSIFEGMDRQAVMLEGGALRLRAEFPQDDICFNGPGSVAAFAGERQLTAETPDGRTALWNVMHRRGQVQAVLSVFGHQAQMLPTVRHLMIYVMSGEVELALPQGRSQGIAAGCGLHLQQVPPQAWLLPCRSGSKALLTAIA